MNAKELIAEYMRQVWVDKNVYAIAQFTDANLVQHNPNLQNGRDALLTFVSRLFADSPELTWNVLRLVAEDEMVVVHSHAVPAPGALGTLVVDIFRVVDGHIVEHWDVIQEVAGNSASGNSMY